MDIKEPKYVCALAETGNVTRAAEKLYISPPALSTYINNLEKNLGLCLFDRSGKKFTLTYAGERYVKTAYKMLELERKLNQELSNIQNQQIGRLRLGISLRRASWFLPPVLADFSHTWPDIDVIVRQGNILDLNEMLKKRELDLVILNEEDADPQMEMQTLFEEEFLLAVPFCHELDQKTEYVAGSPYRKLNPVYLNGQNLILSAPFQSSRVLENKILSHYHIIPHKIMEIRSTDLAVQMAAEGLGVTMVREGFAKTVKYDKPFHLYMLDVPQHRHKVIVAYEPKMQLKDYTLAMLKSLKKAAASFLR